MTVFIELREKIKAFYARYDIYILPVVKFALAMVISSESITCWATSLSLIIFLWLPCSP